MACLKIDIDIEGVLLSPVEPEHYLSTRCLPLHTTESTATYLPIRVDQLWIDYEQNQTCFPVRPTQAGIIHQNSFLK
jgi:hypothetical protein